MTELVEIRLRVQPDDDPDTSWMDAEELAELERGDIFHVGVVAEAELLVQGVRQRVSSGGIWSVVVSSITDDYLVDLAREQWGELVKILRELGVNAAEIADHEPTPFQPREYF